MMKNVLIELSDEEHYALNQLKTHFGFTWKELLISVLLDNPVAYMPEPKTEDKEQIIIHYEEEKKVRNTITEAPKYVLETTGGGILGAFWHDSGHSFVIGSKSTYKILGPSGMEIGYINKNKVGGIRAWK